MPPEVRTLIVERGRPVLVRLVGLLADPADSVLVEITPDLRVTALREHRGPEASVDLREPRPIRSADCATPPRPHDADCPRRQGAPVCACHIGPRDPLPRHPDHVLADDRDEVERERMRDRPR